MNSILGDFSFQSLRDPQTFRGWLLVGADILLVAFLIYQFLMIIRGRRAAHILTGLWILAAVYIGSVWLHLALLRRVLETLAPYTAFAVIVMFQSEIRRLLARIGRSRLLGFRSSFENREVTDEIVLAVQYLSTNKTGALIVIERDIGLRTFVESGVSLDATVSRDLLIAIFETGGPLHDGAVIVQNGRIGAAACFLPLTMNPGVLGKVGTRHRAAIGVTEETDCLALIVSEETGQVSIATFGELERDVTSARVEERLILHARYKAASEPEAKPASGHPVRAAREEGAG